MKQIAAMLVLTSGFLLAAKPVAAAGQLYLKIPGVVGPSTAKGHTGEIEILSFSVGVSAPSVRAAARAARFPGELCSDLAVMKVLDQTSPILFQHTLFGVDFKNITLTFTEVSGDGQPFDEFTLVMNNVSITSVQESGSSERPVESVSFHATSWTGSFFPTPGGAPVTTTVSCQ
jgi:type VI secretion system secreted protein Hcp